MNIPREEKLAELDKILRGRTLHGSESLRGFLRFVVDKAVEEQEGQLKEYVIATEVFGRGREFDPRIDSVVRVQAGRLRAERNAGIVKSFGILNSQPKSGEEARYFARQDGPSRSQISEDYAVVSLLQGVTGKKRIMILAGGITTLGTQAAAEYVTKPEYIQDLIRHLNLAPIGATPQLPPSFQVLVKVKVNGGVPVQVSYVTHHSLNP